MNRRSIAAAAFSIAAIAAGAGVPVAAASSARHLATEDVAAAFAKVDGPGTPAGPQAASAFAKWVPAAAFMKITGPDASA
jgi:hypothetical protein